MKKKFKLEKGIERVHIPIIFDGDESFGTWREQIEEASKRFLNNYELGKSHYLGFEITDGGAELYVRKKIKGIDY